MSANDNRQQKTNRQPTMQRIEEMLLFAAQLVDTYGSAAQPLLDRMEAEYLKARSAGRATDRIRQLLATG